VHLTVDITVLGPVMTQAGQTTSVDWMGNVPSPDLQAMLGVNKATDFGQFKAALAGWHARQRTSSSRTTRGTSARSRPATGPRSARSASRGCRCQGNQRQVTAAYPYYIGTSADFFDPGYRAATIYQALDAGNRDFPSIQNIDSLPAGDAIYNHIVLETGGYKWRRTG
jgi:penicillin G amidase